MNVILAAEKRLKEAMGEAAENSTLLEMVELIISQRDNARNAEEEYKKQVEQLTTRLTEVTEQRDLARGNWTLQESYTKRAEQQRDDARKGEEEYKKRLTVVKDVFLAYLKD